MARNRTVHRAKPGASRARPTREEKPVAASTADLNRPRFHGGGAEPMQEDGTHASAEALMICYNG